MTDLLSLLSVVFPHEDPSLHEICVPPLPPLHSLVFVPPLHADHSDQLSHLGLPPDLLSLLSVVFSSSSHEDLSVLVIFVPPISPLHSLVFVPPLHADPSDHLSPLGLPPSSPPFI